MTSIKKKVFFVVVAMLGLVLLAFKMNSEVALEGTFITEKQLLRDIKKLGKHEIKITYLGFSTDVEVQMKIAESSFSDGQVVEIFVQNRKKNGYAQPLEVKEAMRIWLYLTQRIPPFSIVGVHVTIDQKWVIDGGEQVLILKDDFEKIYSELKGLNGDEDIVNVLTKMWIEENKYTRMGLE